MPDKFAKERPSHEIVIAKSAQERQQCYDVRIMVFHLEQQFPLETEIDEKVLHDDDPSTEHILLRLTPSLIPIGTIRGVKIRKDDTVYYKLTRLAVLKEYRKFSFGRALVGALHNWVRADALKNLPTGSDPASAFAKVACHSQIPVKGFYSTFGYVEEGPEFDEDGDPHQKMVLQLPLTS